MKRKRHNPSVMVTPRVLYRAVSLPEFVHIMKIGKFTGGGNVFNSFDKRNHVFFGDEIDDVLIWQGEEVDRQAEYVLRNDPMHGEFKTLHARAKDPSSSPRERMLAARAVSAFRNKYIKKAESTIVKIQRKLAKLPVSSVIFVTKRIAGAEVFGPGETGFKDREYGFASSAVTISDIQQVLLVKNRELLPGALTVDEARELANALAPKLWET